jgi:hypothetical protein
MSEGSKQKSKARQLVKQKKRLQNELNPGFKLDEERAKELVEAKTYPTVYGETAKWAEPSKKDEDMKIRRQLVGTPTTTYGATPFGVMTAGPEVIDYLKEKKAQQEWAINTRLAAYLVDPKRPETQERALIVAPQLRELPEREHEKNIAVQEALRVMLRDGFIRGPEDHNLIMEITRDDYVLPVYPLWDDQGSFVTSLNAADKAAIFKKNKQRSLFNPVRYAIQEPAIDATRRAAQRDLKVMILKRLYPGLRDQANQFIIDNFIVARRTPFSEEPAGTAEANLRDRQIPDTPFGNENAGLQWAGFPA